MISVLILDDHPMIIDGLRTALEADTGITYLGSATRHIELDYLLQKRLPDIILMDINLPGKSGIDICRDIKQQHTSVNIIALSTSSEAGTIRRMMHSGASGYLLKDSSKTEILKAIYQVAQGRQYISFSVSEALKDKADEILPVITKREKEVLELIANGFTNPEIAKKLFLTAATIDTHRTNMLLKFNAKNTAELVKLAVSKGFIK